MKKKLFKKMKKIAEEKETAEEYESSELIAFTRTFEGDVYVPVLHVMRPDGSNQQTLGDTRVRGARHPAWSPDSRSLA